MSRVQETAVELLAAGASQVQVAAAVGVDESYISQLMADEQFRELVLSKRAVMAAKHAEIDARIDSIEDRAWLRIEALLPIESNMMRLLKVAQVANAAKRKTGGLVAPTQNTTIVQLTLPAAAQTHFKLSTDRQVVEIEGRSLVTMDSSKVHAAMRGQRAKDLVVEAEPLISDKSAKLLSQF